MSRGRGGGVLPYMGYISSSLLWDKVYKSESWGLEQGIIFQEQLVEDFSVD